MIFVMCAIIWERHPVWNVKFDYKKSGQKCVNQWHKLTTLEKMVADDRSFGFCFKINKSVNSRNNDYYRYFHEKVEI